MNHLELDIYSFYYHHLLPLISRNWNRILVIFFQNYFNKHRLDVCFSVECCYAGLASYLLKGFAKYLDGSKEKQETILTQQNQNIPDVNNFILLKQILVCI